MNKNQVLRSDQPHQVQMPEGSKTASRKSTRKSAEPAIEEPPGPERRFKTPDSQAQTHTETAMNAQPAAPSVRSKARLDISSKTPMRKPSPPAESLRTPARSPAVPPPAESMLWESPSPVMARLQQLRTRNAQIAEQLQRLTLNLPNRGRSS